MSDDRGQALVLAAALLGVAAAAVAAIAVASDVVVEAVRDQRAGEAAVAAAGVAVGDLRSARTSALGRELERDEVALLAADPAATEAARGAALELARAHGRAAPTDVRVLAFGHEIEVHLALAGRSHIALLGSDP